MLSTQVNMHQSMHNNAARHMPLRSPSIMMSTTEHNNDFESSSSEFEAQNTMMTEKEEKKKFTLNKDVMNHEDTSASTRKDNNTENDSLKMTSMKMMAATAAFALAFTPINDADAAMSGGRMGGSFRAPRQTMSRPAMRSSSSSYNRGYSSGYGSRSSMMLAPSMGMGYGYGSAYATPYYGGAGVMAISRGPSVFDLLFVGGLVFAVSQIFTKSSTDSMSSSVDTLGDWTSRSSASALGPGTSIVQLSVALEVSNRDDSNSILSVLKRLSETANTDSRVGIQNVSSQVALEVLRRRSSIVSANSSTKHYNNREQALREFNSRSIQERSKFESETVNKYGGVDYGSSSSSKAIGGSTGSTGDQATMAVITLVLAIDGDSTKLNKINSMSDVEQALRQIAADSKVSDCLQEAEILWTPEDRVETLSVRDVISDYPELRSI